VPVDAARCHRLCVTFVLAGGIAMSLSVRPSPFRVVATVSLAIAAAALAGCAPADSGGSSSTTSGSAAGSPSASASASATCSKDSLKTLATGKLTVATDKPVYEPWFVDDKPENGKGFESAVAYAVAQKLGFAQGDVTWTRVPFDSVVQPGPKKFDFDINEVSITDKRKQAVDFSSGYYDVTQAIITTKGSKIANAKSIADLKNAKIGAQVGTTSLDTVRDVIKPSSDAAIYNTNDDAAKALGNGQIDGLVTDLPTAFYITGSGEVKNSSIVGQFANTGGTPEQFGLVLDKGSSLTTCVTQAVDALRQDGTLKKLEQQWLAQTAGAPVLS
jgi:polar amino acid transport system substrate-binding protein